MIDDTDILHVEDPKMTAAERLYLPQIFGGMVTTFRHLLASMRKPSMTVQYPEEKVHQRIENYRGMHRLNRDEQGRVACVSCLMCATACPANCITIEAAEAPWPDREKYPARFEIDELRCIFCGMCEEACPVDAIELTPEYHLVGSGRAEMILDKDELLTVYDRTKDLKPRKNPRITGYPRPGGEEKGPSASEDSQT